MSFKPLLAVIGLMLVSITLFADPILNINQPVRNIKVTSTQMKEAIANAAQSQHWTLSEIGEGKISATYHKRDYMAKISIDYASNFYSINYADSVRMRYTGTSVHPTYNKLIKALQVNIILNLKTGNFTTTEKAPVVAKAEVAPQKEEDDVRTKLTKIKQLHDDGLITEDEYNTKRKALIDSY